MAEKKLPTFQEFFVSKFKEWENQQEGKRAYLSGYALWLTDNSYRVLIRQQLASDWYYGKYVPKDEGHLLVLEEKFGEIIYDILEIEERPNRYKQIANSRWEFLPLEEQKRIAEDSIRYETENIDKRVQKVSKRRKPRKSE